MSDPTPGSEASGAATLTRNARGQWVPSIPMPYFLLVGVRCGCGRWFLTQRGYEAHYAHHHIVRGNDE